MTGIITLFSRQRIFANDLFLRTLDIAGANIGVVLGQLRHVEREEQLTAMAASPHAAIFRQDMAGKITEWLPGAELLYGYTAEEMIGQSTDSIIPVQHRDAARDVSERVMAGDTQYRFETLRLTRENHQIEVSVMNSPARSLSGKIIGMISTERDISRLNASERRRLNAE